MFSSVKTDPQKVRYSSFRVKTGGVALLGKHRMSWSHELPLLPIFINECKVGTQQMPVIAFSCKIKFLTVCFFLTEIPYRVNNWGWYVGSPHQKYSKLHSRDIQLKSNQTCPNWSWLLLIFNFLQKWKLFQNSCFLMVWCWEQTPIFLLAWR